MSQWTSKYDIMQDLSLVQGCVPVDIDGTIAADDRPPALDLSEETEEDFYKHYTGGGDFNSAPDLGLIQEMLDMVRDIDVSSLEDDEKSKSTDSNTDTASNFVPQNVKETSPLPKIHKDRHKTSRNVAMTSILNMNNASKLLRPEECILNGTDTKKDNEIQSKVIIEPTNMFKKKTSMKNSVTQPEAKATSSGVGRKYQPSTLANEYYNKFVKQSTVKETIKEDIWTKLERQMKEIDEKRKTEALCSTLQDSENSAQSN